MGPVGINPNAVIGVGETAISYVPAMNLLARNLDRLPLTEIITHRMPLERASEAVGLAQRDGTVKVLMDPKMAI
jgi:threonine dehydrogenase-like Zn-dependent dehydrogenase